MSSLESFHSRHFKLEQLAEGVYAAINAEEGWAICNAGIIDLGDRTLIYDTFTAPQAAEDLREAAEALTGRPARLVINSHFHGDHIWGNQVFDTDVNIISTAKTRDLILTEGASEIKWYRETAQKRLDALEAQLAVATGDELRSQLRPAYFDYQAIVAALPILQPRLPNLTFIGEMAFHGSRHSARLIPFENGHCGSDAILFLPDDGIVFMEDTLFIDCHPYLSDGDPGVVQHILAEVKQMRPKIVVPGHGPVGNITQLDILDGYINKLHTLVQAVMDRGGSEEELAHIPIPGEYQHYIFPIFFTVNLQFMYKRQSDR